MLVRILSAVVLLAGCAAPVIQPSLSHSADYESGYRAGFEAALTHPSGQRELPTYLLINKTSDYIEGFDVGFRVPFEKESPRARTIACVVTMVFVVVSAVVTLIAILN